MSEQKDTRDWKKAACQNIYQTVKGEDEGTKEAIVEGKIVIECPGSLCTIERVIIRGRYLLFI